MFEEVGIPWDWPVEVNYHEAKAYCAWRGQGYRLPCEAEHHAIRGSKVRPFTFIGSSFQTGFKDSLEVEKISKISYM